MTVKLLTEQHLEFLSLKGGCTGSSEYKLAKMPLCWKSHITGLMVLQRNEKFSILDTPPIKVYRLVVKLNSLPTGKFFMVFFVVY